MLNILRVWRERPSEPHIVSMYGVISNEACEMGVSNYNATHNLALL